MALLKSVNIISYGKTLNFEDAYHQITYLVGDKNKLNYEVTTYADSSKEIKLYTKEFSFEPDEKDTSKRWDKQAYIDLKNYEEYEGSIDC